MVSFGCRPAMVSDRIVGSLWQKDYKGTVEITLMKKAIESLRRRIKLWMDVTRAPGNLLLISGGGGFALTLMDLEKFFHNAILTYNEALF